MKTCSVNDVETSGGEETQVFDGCTLQLLQNGISTVDVRKRRGEVSRDETKEKKITMGMSCEEYVHGLKKTGQRIERE